MSGLYRPGMDQYKPPVPRRAIAARPEVPKMSRVDRMYALAQHVLPILEEHAQKSPIEVHRNVTPLFRRDYTEIELMAGWPLFKHVRTQTASWQREAGLVGVDYALLIDNGRITDATADASRNTFVAHSQVNRSSARDKFQTGVYYTYGLWPETIEKSINELLRKSGVTFTLPPDLRS